MSGSPKPRANRVRRPASRVVPRPAKPRGLLRTVRLWFLAVRRSPRLRGARGAIRIAFGVLLVLTLIGIGSLELYAHSSGPKSPPVEIIVGEESTAADIAELLASSELVSNRFAASVYLWVSLSSSDLKRGPHLLSGGRSPSELKAMLERSESRPKAKVVIPEGWNHFDIAERLESSGVVGRKAFLAACADPALLASLGVSGASGAPPESAEGWLFPATYELRVDTPADEVLKQMVHISDVRWAELAAAHGDGLERLAKDLGFTRREVVVLASMVEKEAAKGDERPLIASVFLNRLRDPAFKPHKLQSDPSSGYGCLVRPELESCADYHGKITPRMNQDRQNPYSTYVTEGLPPGPISNPGAASNAAVLEPAETKYLYFVAKGGGRHTFSATLEEHNKAIHRDASP
ncbi:MAG: endolytic transglycosylase MltG [Polyangiaceae bacterium]